MTRFGLADAGNRCQMNLRRLYQLLGVLSKVVGGAQYNATPCEGHSAPASDRRRLQQDNPVSYILINLASVGLTRRFTLLHD